MKKIILILSLLLSVNLFAEVYEGINFGFKGGLNLNNVTLMNESLKVNSESYEFQKHFFIGGILKFNFIYNLSLQIEAIFNNKGLYLEIKDILGSRISNTKRILIFNYINQTTFCQEYFKRKKKNFTLRYK